MTNVFREYSINIMNVLYRLQLIDVAACFSWLLTMLVCGWLGESVCRHVFFVRLTLASVTVAVSSCTLVVHCCGSQQSKPRLSEYVLCCFVW